MPVLDYITVTITGYDSGSTQTIYTLPYKALVVLEIKSMEQNSKTFQMWHSVDGDDSRRDYFIDNRGLAGDANNSFGNCKVIPSGESIKRAGDFNPFNAVLHVFRLPENP